MNYWLVKSEPDVFSIDDLKNCPKKTDSWDGVRNYQARNFMKEMQKGDQVLFYHSNAKEIGVVGICKVVKEAYPDHTAWDKKSKYFDTKSGPDNPRWFMVDVKWQESFPRVVSLNEMKEMKSLANMRLIQKGNRLSVMPVAKAEFESILRVARQKTI